MVGGTQINKAQMGATSQKKRSLRNTGLDELHTWRRLVSGLLRQRPGFDRVIVYASFVLDEVVLVQALLCVLRFYAVSVNLPMLHKATPLQVWTDP